jgi:hypothetical protein
MMKYKLTKLTKRNMMLRTIAGVGMLAIGNFKNVFAAEKLSPTDPYAKAMGFKLDTKEVDQTKYPRHTTEQRCQACQLWNGETAELGNCSFFNDSITPKNGWCKNFKAKQA